MPRSLAALRVIAPAPRLLQHRRRCFSLLGGCEPRRWQTAEVVSFAPQQLFEVVADVERYSSFLPFCSSSRVLLRTSLRRELTKSSRECQEMAADLAAYFSPLRNSETVEIMFTDSKHVAKRGSRVGQMKESKKLGTLFANPRRVEELARSAQEEQGWL